MSVAVYCGERFVWRHAFGRSPAGKGTNIMAVAVIPLPRHSPIYADVVSGEGGWTPFSILVELLNSVWVFGELVDAKYKGWLNEVSIRTQYFTRTIGTYTHYHTKRHAAGNACDSALRFKSPRMRLPCSGLLRPLILPSALSSPSYVRLCFPTLTEGRNPSSKVMRQL
jgi:hypothetical protein